MVCGSVYGFMWVCVWCVGWCIVCVSEGVYVGWCIRYAEVDLCIESWPGVYFRG